MSLYLVWSYYSYRVTLIEINPLSRILLIRTIKLAKRKTYQLDLDGVSCELKHKVGSKGFKYPELTIQTEDTTIKLSGEQGGWKSDQVEDVFSNISRIKKETN